MVIEHQITLGEVNLVGKLQQIANLGKVIIDKFVNRAKVVC